MLGFPAYLLDVWLDGRVAVAMICLFFFRWIALCFAGPTPVLSNPLRANLLIILGFALLQASRVRRRGQFGDPSPSI